MFIPTWLIVTVVILILLQYPAIAEVVMRLGFFAGLVWLIWQILKWIFIGGWLLIEYLKNNPNPDLVCAIIVLSIFCFVALIAPKEKENKEINKQVEEQNNL